MVVSKHTPSPLIAQSWTARVYRPGGFSRQTIDLRSSRGSRCLLVCVTVCWVALKILKWDYPTLLMFGVKCKRIMGYHATCFLEVSNFCLFGANSTSSFGFSLLLIPSLWSEPNSTGSHIWRRVFNATALDRGLHGLRASALASLRVCSPVTYPPSSSDCT